MRPPPTAPSFGPLFTGKAVENHFGQSDMILKPWDVSKHPTTNDRIKKLGNLWGQVGAAICSYDKKQRKAALADGLKGGENTLSVLEPDNWVWRRHADKIDRVWALRLSAEHDESTSDRKHRSTMVIDNCGTQTWAFIMDQWWVKKLGASAGDDLHFNAAGFTDGLCPDDGVATGQFERGCVMLNVSRRGGHVTDGPFAGQWWHTHTFKPKGAPAGGLGPGDVDTQTEPGPGDTTTAGGCASTSKADWALRGDVNFLMGNDLMHIAMDYAAETPGYRYAGKHWKNTPSPAPPFYTPAFDPKSDQPTIDRKLEKGIWVYIEKPPDNVPTGGIPPLREFPAPPGGIVVDTKSLASSAGGAGGGFTYGNFLPGLTTDDHFEVGLPEIGPRVDMVVRIKYRLSVLLSGGQDLQLKLAWKLIPPKGDVPAAVTGYVDRTLTIADNPASASKHKTLIFTIKDVGQGQLVGGAVVCQLYRMGTLDSYPGVFKQQSDAVVHFRPIGKGQPIVRE